MKMNSRAVGRTSPFLRIPPFPFAHDAALMVAGDRDRTEHGDQEVDDCIASIAAAQVGGSYWGDRPDLPARPYVLVSIQEAKQRDKVLESIPSDCPTLVWLHSRGSNFRYPDRLVSVVRGSCDPWHLISGASKVYVDADDELALIASIAGIVVECVGQGAFVSLGQRTDDHTALRAVFRDRALGSFVCRNPFSSEQISFRDAAALCVFWKALIDSNRSIKSALGFASWKKPTVAPLLWSGAGEVPFGSGPRHLGSGDDVAIWKSRVPPKQLAAVERAGARTIEVEDGFIRSIGLGADCVPPLSIIVDPIGIYFDPGQASGLEILLEKGAFPADLVERAARLRKLIVESGISKYEIGGEWTPGSANGRRKLLVIGQVEDDRSVQSGGGAVQSNFELLRRVRERNPDAFICYRPHPDVQAGHRTGRIAAAELTGLADEVEGGGAISRSLESADEVHVITSLAGFEALLRGKPVTTYGVPFYAGWGLTTDLGDTPSRRSARRSLDELVAATLLIYPRYLDPVTGLPCPAEVLALRLAENHQLQAKGLLVRLRQLQGRWKRRMSELRLRVQK